MEIIYAEAVLSLREYWKENGKRDDPAKVSGLNKFRHFLEATDQPYSHCTALA